MAFKIDELLTIVFTLFAVIDIVGSIPLLIAMKEKSGAIQSLKVTLISGGLMILFLFLGKPFLQLLGLDVKSFAVGGSIVIFLLGLEMVLGHEIFKGDKNANDGLGAKQKKVLEAPLFVVFFFEKLVTISFVFEWSIFWNTNIVCLLLR